jgi:rod shape-determining protein MreD
MKLFLKILHFIFIISCVIIQISFLEHLKVYFINIDLILVTILAVAIFDGGLYGMIGGFFAGFILDLLIGKIIGVNALIYALTGFLAYKLMETGIKNKITNYMVIIFFFTELNILLYSAIYYLFNLNLSYTRLGLEALISPLCNIVVMFLIFPLINAGNSKKEEIGFVYKGKT